MNGGTLRRIAIDGHDVEPQGRLAESMTHRVQPGGQGHSASLRWSDRVEATAMGGARAFLDFDEDRYRPIPGHDVDLSEAGPEVAFEDREASGRQVCASELLAAGPRLQSRDEAA
jgi:hypothetical protein